ncbi:hypothetical protein BC830DRAFT_1174776 [Chytriomyces sp. MP71]|nr:hypothetical protein BC830DRAFT_1174776 [Chytriomyces sp. MP71]
MTVRSCYTFPVEVLKKAPASLRILLVPWAFIGRRDVAADAESFDAAWFARLFACLDGFAFGHIRCQLYWEDDRIQPPLSEAFVTRLRTHEAEICGKGWMLVVERECFLLTRGSQARAPASESPSAVRLSMREPRRSTAARLLRLSRDACASAGQDAAAPHIVRNESNRSDERFGRTDGDKTASGLPASDSLKLHLSSGDSHRPFGSLLLVFTG